MCVCLCVCFGKLFLSLTFHQPLIMTIEKYWSPSFKCGSCTTAWANSCPRFNEKICKMHWQCILTCDGAHKKCRSHQWACIVQNALSLSLLKNMWWDRKICNLHEVNTCTIMLHSRSVKVGLTTEAFIGKHYVSVVLKKYLNSWKWRGSFPPWSPSSYHFSGK